MVDLGTNSLTLGFAFLQGGTVVEKGRMTSLFCWLEPELQPAPIQESLTKKIEVTTGA